MKSRLLLLERHDDRVGVGRADEAPRDRRHDARAVPSAMLSAVVKLNLTSYESNASPFWNVTPWRRSKV